MAYKDTDYIYASARIRALETKLLTPERYLQLIEAPGEAEAVALLGDAMPVRYDADGKFDLEETADAFLSENFALVRSIVPDPGAFDFLLYAMDANNVKAAIKASFADIPADGMLFSCGTVKPDAVLAAVRDRDFSAFPAHIAEAAKKAMEDYAASGDPQGIDLCIDRAAFADLAEATASEPFFAEYRQTLADSVNLAAFLRLCDNGRADALFGAFLPGGTLPVEKFRDITDREGLSAMLKTASPHFYKAFSPESTLGEVEKAFDELLLCQMRQVKWQPFGAAVVCAYLIAAQYQVKNLRILFSLRATGAAGEEIRRRLRAVM